MRKLYFTKKITVAVLLLAALSIAHAQSYRQATADELRSLSDFKLGATCDTVKSQLESRSTQATPKPQFICYGEGYRTVRVYNLVPDGTLVVGLSPENLVWKLGVYVRPSSAAKASEIHQMLYDKFGRPVLEEDISLGGTVPTPGAQQSFGKLVLKHAWTTSNLNPATTSNTANRLACMSQARVSAVCLAKDAEDGNLRWGARLGELRGDVVIAHFETSKAGMESYSVEAYQTVHLQKSLPYAAEARRP